MWGRGKVWDSASEAAGLALGLVPHLGPLVAAVGPFGLDPRLRQLVSLSVCRAHGSSRVAAVHRAIGRLAGVSPHERDGDLTSLTEAERSAIALALGTVSRIEPGFVGAPADEHFTGGQIEQLRAVALATDLVCRLSALSSLRPRRAPCQ